MSPEQKPGQTEKTPKSLLDIFKSLAQKAVHQGTRIDLANSVTHLNGKRDFTVDKTSYSQEEVEEALSQITLSNEKKLDLNSLLKETEGRPKYQQFDVIKESVTERWEQEFEPGVFLGVEIFTRLDTKEEEKEDGKEQKKWQEGVETKRNYYVRGAETNVGQKTINRLSSLVGKVKNFSI